MRTKKHEWTTSGVNVMEKDKFDEEAWVWKRKKLIDGCSDAD